MKMLKERRLLILKCLVAVIVIGGISYFVYEKDKTDRIQKATTYIFCVQTAEDTFQSAMETWCVLDDGSSADTCGSLTTDQDMDFAVYYRAKYPDSVPARLLTNYEETKAQCASPQ